MLRDTVAEIEHMTRVWAESIKHFACLIGNDFRGGEQHGGVEIAL